MNPSILELIVSPTTGRPLTYFPGAQSGAGRLVGPGGESYPVRNEIPRFVDADSFAESFGYQWSRFNVRQPGEDEATFVAKTGVPLEALGGMRILDAGCGGGRYCAVAAENGACVVGVDRSRAIDKARALTSSLPNVDLVQADLTALPLKPASFDLVYSIGVLHHSPDPRSAFRSIAAAVKPGGRLSIWVYRRNSWIQERLNDCARRIARRLPHRVLLAGCYVGAALGTVPIVNRTLNKVVNFSNHPRWENRLCDTYDWYSPVYQYHHTPDEIVGWFTEEGFEEISDLPPEKVGRLYAALFQRGLIVGSGVNMTGMRK